jgi:hypothetical protein
VSGASALPHPTAKNPLRCADRVAVVFNFEKAVFQSEKKSDQFGKFSAWGKAV